MKIGQCIGLLALGISVYILWQIRDLLLLLFIAIVLTTALNQLVSKLQQLHLQRGLAVFLSISNFTDTFY